MRDGAAASPDQGRAKRSLSQNFLVDPNLQRKILEALDPSASECVIEIGAGHGELGGRLVGRVARLVLVEKDDDLAGSLRAEFGDAAGVEVVHGDALELDLSGLVQRERRYRVLSNLPYSITSPLLFRILGMHPPALRIVVTIQREVAERLVAGPGSKTYGALSVGVQVRRAARIAFQVGRKAFRPVPTVDSAVVVLDPLADPLCPEEEAELRRLTRVAFGQRRKQLQKILRRAPEYLLPPDECAALARAFAFDPRDRPETLSPEQFRALARALMDRVEKGKRRP